METRSCSGRSTRVARALVIACVLAVWLAACGSTPPGTAGPSDRSAQPGASPSDAGVCQAPSANNRVCNSDSDCILVVTPDCERPACGCSTTAIIAGESASYQEELNDFRACCRALHPNVACGDLCMNAKARCCSGTCTYAPGDSPVCPAAAGQP